MQVHEKSDYLDKWFTAAISNNDQYINKHVSDCAGALNQSGKTALMLAGEAGAIEVLSILAPLEAGILSSEERCALEYALLGEKIQSIPVLLRHEGRFMKESGKDPLLFALQSQARESALKLISLNEEGDALDYRQALELANTMKYRDVVKALQCKLRSNDSNEVEPIKPIISGVSKIDGVPTTYITADGRSLSLSMSVSFEEGSRSCSLTPHRPRQIDYDFLLYAKDQEILRLQTLLVQLSNTMNIRVAKLFTCMEDNTALDDVDKLQSDLAAAMLTIDELTDKIEQQKALVSASVPDTHASDNKSNYINNLDNDTDEVRNLRKTVYLLTETINELEDKLRLSASTTDLAERKVTERILTENINLKKTVEALSGKLDNLSKSISHVAIDNAHWSQNSAGGPTADPSALGNQLTGSMSAKLSVGLPRNMNSGAVAMSPGQKLANIALSQVVSSVNASSPSSNITSENTWAYHSDKMITHIDASTPTQSRRNTINRPRAPARRNTQWYTEQMRRAGRVQC